MTHLPLTEQDPDPVVHDLAEAEADPLDVFDQVVDRFGGSVRYSSLVPRGDLASSADEGAAEGVDPGGT